MTITTNIPSLRNFHGRPQYHFDTAAYHAFILKHRQHQLDALRACESALFGQIISPCGTGKTRIQVSLHMETFIAAQLNNERAVCGIASHRLSLNRQLRDEVVEYMVKCGLEFNILSIGSDRPDTDKYYASEEKGGYSETGYSIKVSDHLSTLSSKEAEKFIAQSKLDNRHVLIISTYNSIDRLANVGKIDLITHDEAQNTVRTDFNDNILKIKHNIQREYYFTATRKIKDNDGGMDDTAFYGPILKDISPKDMIECGEITCPQIHIVRGSNAETTNTANLSMLVKSITEAYTMHKSRVKQDSFAPDEVGAKIIVGANGIQEMLDIYESQEFKACAAHIPCFAISSSGAYVNWEKVSSLSEFLTMLLALKDSEDAIIMHVDMLTEGIDLPSITGVMPLRDLGIIKLIQLLGRSLRLRQPDRDRLYAGELMPKDYKNYTKPYGWLIIPEHLNSITESEQMKFYIKSIYHEYGIPIEKLIPPDKYIDKTPNDLTSMLERKADDGKRYGLEHEMLDIVSACRISVFDDNVRYMSPQQRIAYILKLAKESNETPTN